MWFHTWTFLLFFAAFYVVYLPIRRTSAGLVWLLIASYTFYGWWNPYYLVLILYSTWLDFFVVQRMDAEAARATRSPRRRKMWLAVSILNNLGLLGFFKYGDFVVSNANALLIDGNLPIELIPPAELMPFGWEYLLPVGISFYTFQSMSYTIDFYRGRLERERSFLRFAAFVSLFPQLVAGPIERASALLPQLRQPPPVTWSKVSSGAALFLVGLFKKLALANYLAAYVDPVYQQAEPTSATQCVLATCAFAWQIYFDFSGYTDMARGIARCIGFELMANFRHPYLATGLGEFWSRWHISLSTWFRDYVYIPLGGSRGGRWRTAQNLLIVFAVSGVWHGAAWTFVVWGLWHGVWMVLTRQIERSSVWRDRVPAALKSLVLLLIVGIGWVFFRASDLSHALKILRVCTTGTWDRPDWPALMTGLVLSVWLYEWLQESRWRPLVMNAPAQIVLASSMLLYLFLGTAAGGEFIYFQF